jgi:aminoacyl-tRNA hydrolase
MPVLAPLYRACVARLPRLPDGRAVDPLTKWVVPVLAPLYRACLGRVVFIGVTGSCGKTTTKELIAAILATHLRGQKNPGNLNLALDLARTLLRVRPGDDFCVLEIAAAVKGERLPLEGPLGLIRPQIGVVTNIGLDHLQAFQTQEAIAAEKGKLIAALPPHGTAILNVDDAHVRAMAARCAGRVITYGLAPDAMVRAVEVSCAWPERLAFTVLYDGQAHRVHTQLCGGHWVSCVLAALAVGLAMGVPLAPAVQAVATVPPVPERMQPVSRPDGVTFIRDDWKAPLASIPLALEFMNTARVQRKIVVIGTISDYRGNPDRIYATVARQALDVADHVVFIGPHASKSRGARSHPRAEALQAFSCVEAAWDALGALWQPGDLVLLKDSGQERLDTLLSVQPPGNVRPRADHDSPKMSAALTLQDGGTGQAVIGLGNPGKRFRGSPHNVGQQVLDRLAHSLGGTWAPQEQALVACVAWQGTPVYLIKPLLPVNATGAGLLPLIQRLGFGPAACILVHDDAALPLGTVRVRMRGSDGGHRGVRSILDAFRTQELRRVKVGVGQPGQPGQLTDYVVTAFAASDLPSINRACAQAADRLLELVKNGRGQA